MRDYQFEKEKTLNELLPITCMVLATSKDDVVSARSMSVIVDAGKIYFQTSTLMEKYSQLAGNGNVALCVGNIQIKGSARDVGPWKLNGELMPKYEEKHRNSYKLYGNMQSQTVIEVTIKNIKKWDYADGKPYIYYIDFENETVANSEYDTSK